MPEICASCKEPEYDPEEQVCKACGIVTEGIKFGLENTGHSSYLPSSSSKSTKKRVRQPLGLKFGMDILNSLCTMYSVSNCIKNEVTELLKKIHSSKSFHLKQDIGVMAGVCLIHVLRRYNCHIPINDLCKKLKCAKKSISKCLKIVRHFSEPCQPPSAAEETGNYSSVKNISDINPQALETTIQFIVTSIPDDSKALLIEKTTELVKLAFSLWLGTGRSMEGMVVASAYLCWKSMDPSRRTLSLAKFCKDFSINAKKARFKVPELNKMLLKLGKKIPSVTEDYVTEKNVLFHLDYILKNSTTLRNDIHSDEFDMQEITKKEFSMFRRPPIKTFKNKKIETDAYDPDMRASDVEISDTEIDSYIRSEEQVKVMEALRNLNKEESSE